MDPDLDTSNGIQIEEEGGPAEAGFHAAHGPAQCPIHSRGETPPPPPLLLLPPGFPQQSCIPSASVFLMQLQL